MALVLRDQLPESFNDAFERLRRTINAEDARMFASKTMQDVWNSARRIERQLEAKRSLRNFNRIQKFLAGIEQYSKIVEVLCNQTPYLPFIWAPIKLFLEISQANLSALDKLIDAYAMIGEAMPRFDKLSAAFNDDQGFQQVLGQFYEDILEFHRRAYKFFRRRAWKIVFESLWKTFNSRFEFILESLKKHRDLIDQEVNAINIVEAKAWRNKQFEEVRQRRVERAEDLDRMEREKLARQLREAAAWLGANEEQENTLAKLLRAHDSMDSHWALATPTILSWIEQGRENLFLWINGKPGAGKSVICSKIIDHIQEKTDMPVLFYFCHHHQTSKEPISEVFKSFTTQLLTANPGLAPYILDTFVNNGRKPAKKILAEILERLIASSGPVRFVVDGLDEWSQDDQEDLTKDLLRIRGPLPGACKILCSSRKTAHLAKLLQLERTFRLEDYVENITSNIASFIHEPLERLRRTFGPELIIELENEILKRADGMFLWVRLILYTLEGLFYEHDVRETIKTLPNGLDALYERILLRICGNGRDPNQRRSVRILQWMLVAQRLLKRAELESGIILDDQVHQMTMATRARGNVLSLCFPLIEVDEDPSGYVSFCHFTALEFLRQNDTFAALQPPQAHVTVSLSCVLYLASSLNFVDPSVAEPELRVQVLHGFHELLLYACDHWLDHLQALADRQTCLLADQGALSGLQQGLENLSRLYDEVAALQGRTCEQQEKTLPNSCVQHWGSLKASPSVRTLLNQCSMSTDQGSTMTGGRAGQYVPSDGNRNPILFTRIRLRYKSITEDILNLENSTDALICEYRVSHGSGSYLCSYSGCPRASQGFSSQELRQQHEESHEPRFQCSNPACGFWKCSSEAALRKHNAKYHDSRDVSCVPDSLNSSLSGAPQERSLFRLATPSKRSPMQQFPTNEPLAGTGSPEANALVESSVLRLPPPDGPHGDYIAQLILQDNHRPPPGWRAEISLEERVGNIRQMLSTPWGNQTDVGTAVGLEVDTMNKAVDHILPTISGRRPFDNERQQSSTPQAAHMKAYSRATEDAEQDTLYSRREQNEDQDIGRDSQVSQVAGKSSAKPLYYGSPRLQQQDLQLPSKDAKRRKRRRSSQDSVVVDDRARLKHLEQKNYQNVLKKLQRDPSPGSDLVHSVDTTAAVSAPDMSTNGALASDAAVTGPGFETSRQSDPTLQTRNNLFEAQYPYARSGLSTPNARMLSYSDPAGGVPNDGRSYSYPDTSSILNESMLNSPDWLLDDPKDKPEIEHSTTYVEGQSSTPRPFETSDPPIRMPFIYQSPSLSSFYNSNQRVP